METTITIKLKATRKFSSARFWTGYSKNINHCAMFCNKWKTFLKVHMMSECQSINRITKQNIWYNIWCMDLTIQSCDLFSFDKQKKNFAIKLVKNSSFLVCFEKSRWYPNGKKRKSGFFSFLYYFLYMCKIFQFWIRFIALFLHLNTFILIIILK